jgi:hypothetical protein
LLRRSTVENKMDENEKRQQKELIREVVNELVDRLNIELGKFVWRAFGTAIVLGVVFILAKLGMIDRLLGL